jgi:hypothetical protein
MKFKFLILFYSLILLAGCTVYTEKQSEALSQNVYAANDSVNKGRVDLAYYYTEQTTRLVKEPKHRIKISAVYEAGDVVKNSKKGSKSEVVLVPNQYSGSKVVVIGSTEYQTLLKDRDIKNQISKDAQQIEKDKKNVTDELTTERNNKNKILDKLNADEKLLVKKDLAILWRNVIIVGLLGLIALYFYAKANGLFFL